MIWLIIVNQGFKWLKVLRPILCLLYWIGIFVVGVFVFMEGAFGGEDVFNREFTKCSQQEKNEYFKPEQFSNIIGIDAPKEYDVIVYDIHLYGPDTSTEYTLQFAESLSNKERESFIEELQKKGFEKIAKDKYNKYTDKDEILVKISNKNLYLSISTY